MFKFLSALVLSALLYACAVMGTTPEAQIERGANTHAAASSLVLSLLDRRKITLAQAQHYRGMLGTASAALDGSAATLKACRAVTVPAPAGGPDKCQQNISADINLSLVILAEIETTLKKQAAK
jgi:hypothetical protein